MKFERLTILLCVVGLLAACTGEPPPPTVLEFMENPVLLDATIVRCGRDRSETRYDQECVNARDAADRLAVAAEAARSAELKAESERKQAALRHAQEVAAAARRRLDEAERQRQEAAYLRQFGVAPGDAAASPELAGEPEAAAPTETSASVTIPPETAETAATGTPAPAGRQSAETVSDLEAVREELEQRQQH